MSDELAIQPQVQQKSALPYVATGAVIGGGLGAAGAYATSPAKYTSYEDIIKEADDKFESTVKEAISDTEQQNKAIQARKDAKAYIEANKNGAVVPDENYNKLEADLKAKTEAYDAKRTELVNAKIEELKKANPTSATEGTKKTATLAQTMQHKAHQLYSAGEDKAKLATLENELKATAKDIAEKLEYTGTPEEIKAAKEKVANEIVDYTHQLVAQKDIANAKVGKPKAVKEYLEVKQAQQDATAKIDSAFKTIQEQTGKDLKELYTRDQNLAANKLKAISKGEKNRLEMLKKLQTKYTEAAAKNGNGTTIKGWQLLKAIIRNGDIPIGDIKDEKTILEKFTEGLSKSEKQAFEKLFNGNVDAKIIEEAINKSEGKLNALSQAWTSITDAGAAMKKANADIKIAMENITTKYGEGAYVKNGILYGKDHKPIKAPKAPKATPPTFTVPEHAKLPEGFKVEYTVGASAPLTEEQIAQKAKEAITDDMMKVEAEAKNAAQKLVDEAKAKLPKGEAKTQEQLIKEFVEKNGKTDVEALLKRKPSNKKLLGFIAGGAVLAGILGKMFAPKNEQV